VRAEEASPSLTYLPIAGTHGWRGNVKGEWWRDSSPFASFLAARGVVHLAAGRRPFIWSTDLNGHRVWRRILGFKDFHSDWEAAGHALQFYLRPFNDLDDRYVPIVQRNLIVHSHALQVVLYACAYGLKINSLVSVMGPVRADMMQVAEHARPNIARWLCLHSDYSDRIAVAGAFGDGRIRVARRHPMADPLPYGYVPNVGHSKVLSDEQAMRLWDTEGWIDWLREGSRMPAKEAPGGSHP
jgi:hypothetical protein